jgi:hypothetical protein
MAVVKEAVKATRAVKCHPELDCTMEWTRLTAVTGESLSIAHTARRVYVLMLCSIDCQFQI